jgi:lipoprotein
MERKKGGKEMKKILLGIVVMGILGSCANWEDTKKDWESSTEGLKRKVEVYTLDGKLIKTYEGLMRVRSAEESSMVSLNLIEEGNRRIMIDNAIVIIEEK